MAGHENPDYNTLDIPELQMLVEFPGDANGLDYHHRIFFYTVEGARWIVGTPDWHVYAENVGHDHIVPLRRNARFPADHVAETYAFDREEARANITTMRAEAKALAVVLGCLDRPGVNAGGGTGPQGDWRIADVDHDRFGEIVLEGDLGNDDENVLLEVDTHRRRLHYVDEQIVTLEFVTDFNKWSETKRPGVPGGHAGDLRLLGCVRNSQGRRVLPLHKALELMTAHTFKDWPHRGPPSLRELLESIVETAGDLDLYVTNFIRRSGVAENTACIHELKNLILVLKLGLTYDQLDAPNLAAFEQIARRVMEIQSAVRRNPRHPQFDVMESTATAFVDEVGGARATTYNEWLTEQQRSEGKRLKAAREYREEQAADSRRRRNDDDAPPSKTGGKDGKGRKTKKEKEEPP